MFCIQKRCKLAVVVLLFTVATYNTRVLSNCYSNTTRRDYLGAGGARLYEYSNIPTSKYMITLVPAAIRLDEDSNMPIITICLVVTLSCLPDMFA